MSHTSGYFHTDDKVTLHYLANVVRRAETENLSLRLHVVNTPGNRPRLMVKLGSGMWTAPLDGTFDAYRDL